MSLRLLNNDVITERKSDTQRGDNKDTVYSNRMSGDLFYKIVSYPIALILAFYSACT